MTAANLVDRLAAHKALGAAPREELAWLASHGTLRQLHTGDVLTAKGARPEGLFVVLSGTLRHVRRPRRGACTRSWNGGKARSRACCRIRAWSAHRAIRSRRNPRRSWRYIAIISAR